MSVTKRGSHFELLSGSTSSICLGHYSTVVRDFVYVLEHVVHTGASEKVLLLHRHLPCKATAETAIQPLLWHSKSLFSHVFFSPEVLFFTDAGMLVFVGALRMSVTRHSSEGPAPFGVSPAEHRLFAAALVGTGLMGT